MPRIKLLKHQYLFCHDFTTRIIGLIGGFGSGKSWSLSVKAALLASKNVGYKGAIYSPTISLAISDLTGTFEEVLGLMGIPFEYRVTPQPKYTLSFPNGKAEVLVRGLENWQKIRSLNLAWIVADEIDTLQFKIADRAWKLLLGRVRVGNVRQIALATTPEGFGLCYQIFVKESERGNRKCIHADTRDNPFLDADFVENLFANYDPNLVKAYIEGQFVSLTSGTVYHCFDRALNNSTEYITESDSIPVHIGCDFNRGKMAAVCLIARMDTGLHVIDELVNLFDTPHLISAIKQKFPGKLIIMYPDAAGQHGTTGKTDVQLLQEAGFSVRVPTHNPEIIDRVNTVNAALCNARGERRVKVNTLRCPFLTDALEQQTYDERGMPDKTRGLDHVTDSFGYVLTRLLPISSPVTHAASGDLQRIKNQDKKELPPEGRQSRQVTLASRISLIGRG